MAAHAHHGRDTHLRLVDIQTGEILHEPDDCPKCFKLREELASHRDIQDRLDDQERQNRTLMAQIRQLRRQLSTDLQTYEHSDAISRIYELWKKLCKHPRSPLDRDRADAIRKILMVKLPDGTPAYSERDANLAVLGAAAMAYRSRVAKGEKKHDSIGLIFRNCEKFEDFVNRGITWLNAHPEWAHLVEVHK